MKSLPEHISAAAIPYDAYFEHVQTYAATNTTSGPTQSESLSHYTKLNASRMRRLNKQVRPSKDLIDLIDRSKIAQKWIIITEAWCGDAAQNIPYVARLAQACVTVELGFVYRDEHLAYMDAYLTRGGRSIPKLIIYRADNLSEITNWGPRPAAAQKMVDAYKAKGPEGEPFAEFSEKLHKWYQVNANIDLENELLLTFQSLTK